MLSAPVGTRTPNLLIRNQMLYPIELRAPNSTIWPSTECRRSDTWAHRIVPFQVLQALEEGGDGGGDSFGLLAVDGMTSVGDDHRVSNIETFLEHPS